MHGHYTRRHDLLHAPRVSSHLRSTGVSVSNYLTHNISRDCKLDTYKERLKVHIRENSNDVLSCLDLVYKEM